MDNQNQPAPALSTIPSMNPHAVPTPDVSTPPVPPIPDIPSSSAPPLSALLSIVPPSQPPPDSSPAPPLVSTASIVPADPISPIPSVHPNLSPPPSAPTPNLIATPSMLPDTMETTPLTPVQLRLRNPLHGYSGYTPKSAADFYQHTHHSTPPALQTHTTVTPPVPPVAPDLRRASPITITIFCITILLALILAILMLVGSHCRLNLCDKFDRSTLSTTPYNFKSLPTPAPLRLIAAVLAFALLALAALAAMIARLTRTTPPPPEAAQLFAHVRPPTILFLRIATAMLVLTSVPLFILLGFATSWRTAAAFAIGLLAALFTPAIAAFASLRGTPRVVSALAESTSDGMRVAARVAAVVPLSGVAPALIAVCVAYLTMHDVRALLGLAGAFTFVAMILRLSSTVFANVPTAMPPDVAISLSYDNPALVARYVGSQLVSVVAQATQVGAVFTAAIVPAAVLGASQPYFAADRYALCVFNHLHLDRQCVAYDVPNRKISFAVSLCRMASLYKRYPELTIGESNAIFIALPLLLAAVAAATTAGCTAFFPVRASESENVIDGEGEDEDDTNESEGVIDNVKNRRPYTRSVRYNIFLCFFVTTIVAVGLCFGIFGPDSAFGRAGAHDVGMYQLSGTGTDVCRPTQAIGGDLVEYPSMSLTTGRYRPLRGLGDQAPSPGGVGWRLFLCILVGELVVLCAGSAITYVVSPGLSPSRTAARAVKLGAGDPLLEGVGDALLGALVASGAVALGAFVSHRLFGAYGVGLAAVAATCIAAPVAALPVLADVLADVSRICRTAREGEVVSSRAKLLYGAATQTAAFGSAGLHAAAGLAAAAITWVVVEAAGVGLPALEVSGSLMTLPSRHVSDTKDVDVTNPFVVISLMSGIWMLLLMVGMVLFGVCRVATRVCKEISRQVVEEKNGIGRNNAIVDVEMETCLSFCGQGALYETLVPASFGLIWAMAIGMLVGQEGLIATVIGVMSGGGVVGFVMIAIGRRLSSWTDNGNMMEEVDGTNGTHGEMEAGDEEVYQRVDAGTVEWGGSCVTVVMLMVGLCATVVGEVAWRDSRKAWIGGCIMGVWLWSGLFAISMNKHREDARRENDKERRLEMESERKGLGNQLINPSVVSPFFESGPAILQRHLNPRSQLRDVAETGMTAELATSPRTDETGSGTVGWANTYMSGYMGVEDQEKLVDMD